MKSAPKSSGSTVLGINAYHGDSAACLLVDGKLAAAIEEAQVFGPGPANR